MQPSQETICDNHVLIEGEKQNVEKGCHNCREEDDIGYCGIRDRMSREDFIQFGN